MSKLKTTLLAWPALFAVAVLLCKTTEKAALTLFGIDLSPQSSITTIKAILTGLVNQLYSYAGCNIAFFKTLGSITCIAAWICLIMPVIEEFIFRWLLWKLPTSKLPSFKCKAIILAVISSVFFTAAHYIQMPWPDNAFIALFTFGLIHCWLYSKTQAIWYPILLHSLFNLANMALLFVPST